jgi:hypothetical protein
MSRQACLYHEQTTSTVVYTHVGVLQVRTCLALGLSQAVWIWINGFGSMHPRGCAVAATVSNPDVGMAY